MPTTIANDKGLYCGSAHAQIDASLLEAVAAKTPEAAAWAAELKAACTLGKDWNAATDRYPQRHHWTLARLPSGFGNETYLWSESPEGIRAHWSALDELLGRWPDIKAGLKGAGGESDGANLQKRLPKLPPAERRDEWTMTDLSPGWQARGGFAWAIWMGSDRELGYMDDKKRPAGAAGARLFESAAGASRTAKAAKFGGERGPAAIVKLRVDVAGIESAGDGAPCSGPRLAMAQREAMEIREALEEASLSEIARALGEAAPQVHHGAPMPPKSSLAGREDGFASWTDKLAASGSGFDEEQSGFANIRGSLGPLSGAVLRPTAKSAAAKGGYWRGMNSIVKIAVCPVAIDALIGEPETDSLRSAIEWEREQASADALAKISAQALRERASAIESGAAEPRRRSRSL